MSKVKIKPEFLSLLKRTNGNFFSTSELCADYINLDTHKQLSKRQVYQFILRNIQRLLRAGLLQACDIQSGRYSTTKKFEDGNYLIGSAHLNDSSIRTSKVEDTFIEKLPQQLSCLKQELMATLAEAEEYENLCVQHPDMRSSIQELYNVARDRSSQLLGKIKATESLLGLCQN